MIKKAFNNYKKISVPIKATLWFTVSNILQKGVLFLAIPIYTRILTTEQYGNYSIFLSWLEIFEIIFTFRLGWGGYVVGLNKYENDRNSYTSSMQALSILITTIGIIIYIIFADTINFIVGLDSKFIWLIFGLLYTMPAIQFWTVRERVEYRYKSLLYVSTISSILTIGFGTIFAIIFEQKDFAVIFARLLIQGSMALVLIWHNCHKNFTFYKEEYWNRALKFNIPLLPYYMSMVVLHSSDRIIIGNLAGVTQAGIYGVAYTLATCMQLFNSSLTQALQPWMYKRMKEGNIDNIPQIISYTTLLIASLNMVFIAFAPEIIWLVAPTEYQDAIWVIPPLAASVVIMFFYQHFVNIEFYFEESKLTAMASVGSAVLNVALNYLFIPRYGYLAAGYTTLASYLLFAICHYYFMILVCKKKKYNIVLVNIKQLILILLVFLICTVILTMGYCKAIIRYTFVIILFLVIYTKCKNIKKKFIELRDI